MRYGFTITELLVAIGIFVMLLGISVAGFRSGDYASALRFGAANLIATLRDAQTRSQGGQTVSVCPVPTDAICASASACGAPCVSRVPAGGYGVQTNPGGSTTTVFADLNSNARLDAGENIETMRFDARGQVTVVGSIGDPEIDIVFLPPRGAMRVNADPSITTFTMNLTHPSIATLRSVTVNTISGQISN